MNCSVCNTPLTPDNFELILSEFGIYEAVCTSCSTLPSEGVLI